MSLIGKYLCGCDPTEKRSYLMTTQVDGTQRNVRYDTQGYEICPEHGERRYGWKTKNPLPKIRGGLSKPPQVGIDKRDNRDPQEIGREILAKSNGHSDAAVLN